MGAPSNWLIYNDWLLNFGKKLADLTGDTLKVCLVTSASNAINQALAGAGYASITGELGTANGYAAGGQTLTVTWTGGGASATCTLAASAAAVWNASGSGITARAAVIYDDTAAGKPLIAYCLLDATPADVTTPSGQNLTINVGTIFVESRS